MNIITPRKLEFENVADFDFDGTLDDLDLEAPLEIGGGAAYTFSKLVIEADVKWVNWGNWGNVDGLDMRILTGIIMGICSWRPVPTDHKTLLTEDAVDFGLTWRF